MTPGACSMDGSEGSQGLATTSSRLPSTPKEQGTQMDETHPLRRLLDWLRPVRKADERSAQPVPVDPAVIQARDGDVAGLAGLHPAEHINRAKDKGRQ